MVATTPIVRTDHHHRTKDSTKIILAAIAATVIVAVAWLLVGGETADAPPSIDTSTTVGGHPDVVRRHDPGEHATVNTAVRDDDTLPSDLAQSLGRSVRSWAASDTSVSSWAAASETGRQRSHNEDAWGQHESSVFVVADGMGGRPGGAVAATAAVAALLDELSGDVVVRGCAGRLAAGDESRPTRPSSPPAGEPATRRSGPRSPWCARWRTARSSPTPATCACTASVTARAT